jgi:hypothetical protein
MYARQPSRYFTLNEERREVMVTGGLRFHFAYLKSVNLEPVMGLLYIANRGWQQFEYDPPVTTSHTEGPRMPLTAESRFGIAGGLDVRVGGERVAVVPSLRVFRAFGEVGPGGGKMWQWTVRPSAALRLEF